MVFNKDIERLMNEMNQNMEKLTREFWNKSKEMGMEFSTQPSMDVINKGEKMIVKMDMPGVNKEDINIRTSHDMLEVSAERKEAKEEKEEDYYRRERRYTGYKRSLSLPKGAKPDEIKAEYEDGVLKITMPKKERKKEKQKIEVK